MFTQYTLRNGEKKWMFQTYLGIDILTGKPRKTTRRGFKTKKEAKLALAELELHIKSNGFKNTIKSEVIFQEIYLDWLEQYKNTVKESTFVVQKKAIDLHILPHFGKIKLKDISIRYCQKQANNWHRYYKKYSNLIGLTTQILDYAITLKYLSDNSMKHIIKPKKKAIIDEEQFDNYYTKEELIEFLDIVKEFDNPEFTIIYQILAYTGIRKGELLGLRWKDINFIENEISLSLIHI